MHNGNGKGKHSSDEQSVGDLINDVTEKGKTLLNESLANAKELIKENAAVLREKAEEWGMDEVADDVKTYVRRNPWRSLSMAAAVGFIAGLLLKSKPKQDRAV